MRLRYSKRRINLLNMKFTVSQPHSASEYYTMDINESFTHRFVLLYSAVARTAFICFDTPQLLHMRGISVWNLGSVDVHVSLTPQSSSFLTRAYVHPRLLMTSRKVNECRPECEPGPHSGQPLRLPGGRATHGSSDRVSLQATSCRNLYTGVFYVYFVTCIVTD